MRALVYRRYGGPEVLESEEVEKPVADPDQLLVRVRASSVNALEWHAVTGRPVLVRLTGGLRRPKEKALGTDFAGIVEAVGDSVTGFRPGDEVFGGGTGAYAEYLCVRADRSVVLKPANLSFEEAAAVPVAGVTALQALRDKGQLKPGWKVLINGASGGVGTFAVQVAKALGAEVTAVCSTANLETAQRIGADRVIDYTKEDFTRDSDRYQLMIDVSGTRSWADCRRVLTDDGKCVIVGSPDAGFLLGPLKHLVAMSLGAVGSKQKVVTFFATITKESLQTLKEMLESGKVTPVIDRSYELSRLSEALAYLGEGHARGKIAISVPGDA
jgi:NADPH:quinone reductase-like Zn-dependent oxidoreductase